MGFLYWRLLANSTNVLSENETLINNFLERNYCYFQDAVDKEYVSKSAIIASAMRREIFSIKIGESGTLAIEFETRFRLIIPINVAIANWQWCLNKTGQNPYIDYIVACFWESEVKVNTE